MSVFYKTYFHGGSSRKNTKVLTKRIPRAFYKKVHATMPIVCVDLVVKRGKEFLLVKRKNNPLRGEWFFPGGRVLKNETLKNAALRKLKEETGLGGKVKKFFGTGEHFENGYFAGIQTHIITFVFLVETAGRLVSIDAQSAGFSWRNSIAPSLKPYIKDFLRKAGFK
ncbi:MAG: NUDIX domain-containing protein [bacterium]|nr:NUDIX domain-containing protein [bacterium]